IGRQGRVRVATRMHCALLVGGRVVVLCFVLFRVGERVLLLVAQRARGRHWQRECERAADAQLAGDGDVAAEQAGELARDAEAETRSAEASRRAVLDLPERVEDAREVLL